MACATLVEMAQRTLWASLRWFFLLGGHRLNDIDKVEAMLSRFWAKYATVDPDAPRIPQRTIPYLLHGDEGRGQLKRPLLVISYQPIISWSGEDFVNSKKRFGILAVFVLPLRCFFAYMSRMRSFFTNDQRIYVRGIPTRQGCCLLFSHPRITLLKEPPSRSYWQA